MAVSVPCPDRVIGAVPDDASFVAERRGTLGSAVHTPDACEWFHASADRASAEKLLQGLGADEAGLFLVRPSSSSPGDFALSVLHRGDVLHLQVHRHREDAFFSVDGGPVVHGLEELVAQSSCPEGAPWGCPLGRPCPGGGPPPPDTRRHGRTNLLHRAIRQGDLVVVRELLRVGYATEAKDEDGRNGRPPGLPRGARCPCWPACSPPVPPPRGRMALDATRYT